MGSERTEENGKVSGSTRTASTAGGSNGSPGSPSSQGGNAGGNTAGASKETGVPGLATVEGKQPKAAAVNVPQADGSKKKVTSNKKSNQKKKPDAKAAKKEADKAETSAQISLLLQTVTDIASMKFGELWKLDAKECDRIAAPLTSILDRYNLINKVAEQSDWIALGTALAIPIGTRVVAHQVMKKQKGGVQLVDTRKQERPSGTNGLAAIEQAPHRGEGDVKQLLAITNEFAN